MSGPSSDAYRHVTTCEINISVIICVIGHVQPLAACPELVLSLSGDGSFGTCEDSTGGRDRFS